MDKRMETGEMRTTEERVWFTSDTHFGHRLMADMRGFTSIQEHDNALIENWNSKVNPQDRVYHLGDFALGSRDSAAEVAGRLNGRIYLIRGNHESVALSEKVRDRFVWIKDVEHLKIDGQKIFLSHYAHRVWPSSHYGAWHLYGHSHGNLETNLDSYSLDVGVDCWELAPAEFCELVKAFDRHKCVAVGHPNEKTNK